jgi:hypothetical protein
MRPVERLQFVGEQIQGSQCFDLEAAPRESVK